MASMEAGEGDQAEISPAEHCFGVFRYDARLRQLFRDGTPVALMPKAVDTLHVLLEHRGEVVEKSELMRLVWPGVHVEEIGLARNISTLRKALGAEAGTYIETIPKRGYRFTDALDPPPTAVPLTIRPRKRIILFGSLAVVAVCALLAWLIYWQFYTPSRYLPAGDRDASLAVVPFEMVGSDQSSFTAGLNALLPVKLAQLARVHVISPTTVRRHQNAGISTGLMGRLLALDVLVEGTVQQIGGLIRVTARLVDVHTGKVIWADTYDYPDSNPAAAQASAAQAIAAQIGAHLAIHDRFHP